jgi:glutamyl-tRNA reductase
MTEQHHDDDHYYFSELRIQKEAIYLTDLNSERILIIETCSRTTCIIAHNMWYINIPWMQTYHYLIMENYNEKTIIIM